MKRILGKASSINVRKVLWTCAELNINYSREDYGSGFQPVDTDEFRALVRKSPAHQDAQLLAAGIANWNQHIGIIDQQLEKTGALITGDDFTLADIVLGLSVSRWLMAPFDKLN